MSLRERLRVETRDEHESTERLLKDLMAPNLSLSRYVEILRAFWDIHRAVEEFLAGDRGGSAGRYFASRSMRRSRDLEEDLRELGESPLAETPRDDLGTVVGSEAGAWGLLYVVEGSALGGQMIAKHLRTQFGGRGLRFFEGAGAATGIHWREFVNALDNPLTHADPDATIEAARRSFLWMGRRLSIAPSI